MPLESYSPCPGGTGKKIKFCCNDLLPELQKIDRMIEGEQFTSCLQHIERLMEKEANRDRACLLAMKCIVLRGAKDGEGLKTTTADFLAKHPDNQIALAESAMLAVQEDPPAGFALLLRAMRAAGGKIELQTYQAMGLMAAVMHHRGFPIPARGLATFMCEISPNDGRTKQMLDSFSHNQTTPLPLRDDPFSFPPPEGAAWQDRFTEAIEAYGRCDWLASAERFEALAAEQADSPSAWRNLANARALLADNPGAIEALRRFSALRVAEENGTEDAADAEELAMFLSDDPLGDRVEMLRVELAVKDVELAQESMLSSPLCQPIPFDQSQFISNDMTPPKAVFMFRDRPMPESAEGLSLETVPHLYGQMMLFGRQTDREARLELLGVSDKELPNILAVISDAVGDAVETEPKRETIDKISAGQKMLRPAWDPPQDTTVEQYNSLTKEYVRQCILEKWPETELGVLDGRSPREAAADPAYRARLLGAIKVFREWAEQIHGETDFDALYDRLGLPKPAPIDTREKPVESIHAIHLDRVAVEDASDKDLLELFAHASEFGVRPALRKFAMAITERPGFKDSEDREAAYVTLAQTAKNLDEAIEYVEQGRKLALAAGRSCAVWDLMELSFNFALRNGNEAQRLMQHISSKHGNEPGISEALMQLMVEVGILRPNGTPAFDPNAMDPSAVAQEASAEPEPDGLWTPDAEQSGGGGKLWTPGD